MNSKIKGKIAVLIEEHFDETEYRRFNQFFPEQGYEVEYISHLWNQDHLTFKGNDHTETVTVTLDCQFVNPNDYQGLILIGGYAMDRLRYQVHPAAGKPNQSPAVEFLRQAMKSEKVKIGTICHSLWLLCADRNLLEDRKVTCAHNIITDVENAGGVIIYEDGETVATCVDENLISARHPGVVEEFMQVFLSEIEAS